MNGSVLDQLLCGNRWYSVFKMVGTQPTNLSVLKPLKLSYWQQKFLSHVFNIVLEQICQVWPYKD